MLVLVLSIVGIILYIFFVFLIVTALGEHLEMENVYVVEVAKWYQDGVAPDEQNWEYWIGGVFATEGKAVEKAKELDKPDQRQFAIVDYYEVVK